METVQAHYQCIGAEICLPPSPVLTSISTSELLLLYDQGGNSLIRISEKMFACWVTMELIIEYEVAVATLFDCRKTSTF